MKAVGRTAFCMVDEVRQPSQRHDRAVVAHSHRNEEAINSYSVPIYPSTRLPASLPDPADSVRLFFVCAAPYPDPDADSDAAPHSYIRAYLDADALPDAPTNVHP